MTDDTEPPRDPRERAAQPSAEDVETSRSEVNENAKQNEKRSDQLLRALQKHHDDGFGRYNNSSGAPFSAKSFSTKR